MGSMNEWWPRTLKVYVSLTYFESIVCIVLHSAFYWRCLHSKNYLYPFVLINTWRVPYSMFALSGIYKLRFMYVEKHGPWKYHSLNILNPKVYHIIITGYEWIFEIFNTSWAAGFMKVISGKSIKHARSNELIQLSNFIEKLELQLGLCDGFIHGISNACMAFSEIWPRGRLRAGRGQRPNVLDLSLQRSSPQWKVLSLCF